MTGPNTLQVSGEMKETISQEHYHLLVEQFNATEDTTTLEFCLPGLFETIAQQYPGNIAVISGDTKLDYRAVNAYANRLAHMLVEVHGIGRGDAVGVALDRSADMVITILAVLKSGAAYVPMDPSFPPDRILRTINDVMPKRVIASESALAALSPKKEICLSFDEIRSEMESADTGNLSAQLVKPDDLAYVIYTSGSTGLPKGVEANHRALCNLLLSMQRLPGCVPEDRLLAAATISFDMSILDLLLPLVSGAAVVIPQTWELRDTSALLGLMERHKVTMIQATPSFFQMLMNGGWHGTPRLSKVLTAGEPVSRRQLERLLDNADNVFNGYGPTEATVYSSVGRVTRNDEAIVIGRPIANFRLYVLRSKDLSVAPLGELGELYVGGVGVDCGYRNNPELTRRNFLDKNPFHKGRLYRTGDLARFVAPGQLSIVGRTDSQVKVRGHRIELGDISAAITEHPLVSEAHVLLRGDHLVAYYKRGDASSKGRLPSLDGDLRSWLVGRRPNYMIPTYLLEMERFPMTLNGKINKDALPDPTAAAVPRTRTTETETQMELEVLTAWASVLGHDRFGINDNFFEAGGDSVRIPHLRTELERRLDRPVPAAKLFEHYTIKTLAAYLDRGSQNSLSTPLNSSLPSNESAISGCTHDDIAIVSMACRFPGGINSPDEYWDLLKKGGDAITDVPKGRWDADAIYSADPSEPGKSYCRQGGFISEDLDGVCSFDAPFFGIAPKEARSLSPEQHIMLETCWEAFEHAGYSMHQLRGSQTGVFVGQTSIAAYNVGSRRLDDLDGYAVTGSTGASTSGRISYVLGLEGPSLTVDTACSSSLVSTHLACTALRQGECDMAVAGGVALMLTPALHVEFSRLKGISADGVCRAFDDQAGGTGFSEGSAALVLKRLRDAQRDGDVVHAVLRGTAVNHGGRAAASFTTPSGPAQARLIRRALAASGLGPDDIDYVDAHGTATKLGDPIEGTALAEVFQERPVTQSPLWVGSAKSNIGHTQAAAGLASLIKVVLALKHDLFPRTLHVSKPTSLVDWEVSRMALVLENQPWVPTGSRRRRAGVSSFGISGTNAHVIIEEAPPSAIDTRQDTPEAQAVTMPFLLSAQNGAALQQQVERLRAHVTKIGTYNRQSFFDMAYSLATSRTHFRRRLAFLARDETDLLELLESCINSGSVPLSRVIRGISRQESVPRLAIMFTGQGSQQLGMGKLLYNEHPTFRRALDDIVAHFDDLGVPLLDVMWAEPGSEEGALLMRTDFAQPALFALETALFRLWQSCGLRPFAVVGHSIGEIVAAHVAGVLGLSDACRLVSARGRYMHKLASSRPGGMASIEANGKEVTTAISTLELAGSVDVAGLNTPTQTVVSGDSEAVGKLTAHFSDELGRKVKTLDVPQAFHSFHMDDMLPPLRAVAATLWFHPPELRVVSSVTGKMAEPGQLESPDYWVQQVRQPVRFSDSFHTLRNQQGVNMFLELGPRPVLSGMAASSIATTQQPSTSVIPVFLPSLNTGKRDDSVMVGSALAELHVNNVSIDWAQYFQPFSCQRVQLPTYAFQRQCYNQLSTSLNMEGGRNGVSLVTNDIHSKPVSLEDKVNFLEFEISWHHAEKNDFELEGGTHWGVWCPNGMMPWGLEVWRSLSQAGIHLTQVETLQDAGPLDGLICLWCDTPETDMLGQALSLASKALVQLQTAAANSFAQPIVWITRQAVGARFFDGGDKPATGHSLVNGHSNGHNDQRERSLTAAPLWGLMRTARSEHPELRLRLIDLDLERSTSETLASALVLSSEEPECAVRQGRLLVPRMQKSPGVGKSADRKTERIVTEGGTVLITGGLGGIGKQVAKWLATTHNVRSFVLASRRGLKTPGADAVVTELEQLGATAVVTACDVGDYHSMRRVFAMFDDGGTSLRGIVHAAGIVDNGVLSTMTPQRCATVFTPKVAGAWNLHQLSRRMALDFFVMFSSVAGILGSLGLGNYAAANTFLDALADLRREEKLPATCVAYGVWEGDGMVAGLTGRTTLAHLDSFGLGQLSPVEGLKLLERAISSDRALTVAAKLNLERLEQYLTGAEADNGTIPPFYRHLFKENASNANRNSDRHNDARAWSIHKVLRESNPSHHPELVLSLVRDAVTQALGFKAAEEVDVDVPLKDLGFDSLTAVLIRNQLANLTSLTTLSAADITWKYPNLRALSQFLLSQLQPQAPKGGPDVPSSRCDVSNATIHFENDRGLNIRAVAKGCLDPAFTFDNITKVSRPRSLFITGATGFVGAFILREVLERGVPAYCLLRARDADHGRERLTSALATYDLWKPHYDSLLRPVVGDASKAFFGLPQEVYNELADSVDAICHSSALVDWMRPLSDYIGPNVVSAHEVLRLASSGRGKAVHVISTLATLPMHLGYYVPEDDREYGYSTSKYMAESMVAAARWRGAKASVYRIPFVTASTEGQFRRDRGDFLHNMIVGGVEMGCFPSLDADFSVVQPVDYLTKTITSVVFDDLGRVGRDFDFVNKYAARADHFFQLMDMLNGGGGGNLVSFAAWQERALAYAAEHPRSSLARIATVIEGLRDETAAAMMLKGLPTGANVFGGDVYPAPEVDTQLVRNYFRMIDAARTKTTNGV